MISQDEYYAQLDVLLNEYVTKVISYVEYKERLEELSRYVEEDV